MIDKTSFNFNTFFQKYNLKYSDELVNELIEAFNDPLKALFFIKQNCLGRCIELEPIIKNGHFDRYCHMIIKSIAYGWRSVDRTNSIDLEERIIDGAAWQLLYALKNNKIPNFGVVDNL